jgi:hypothetical protein
MTNRKTLLCALVLLVCLAAPAFEQPGLISSGSTRSRDGWRLSYSTLAKPAMSGQHTSIQNGVSHTDADSTRPVVFHRFLGDPAAKTYFGYDVVVEAHGNSAKLKFQPISAHPGDLPKEYQAAGSRILTIREFPAKMFESGQTIAVALLADPNTGQKVVDYVHVEHSYLDVAGQVLEDFIHAIHRHFEAHQKAFHERQ